jgi:hypothetical protein
MKRVVNMNEDLAPLPRRFGAEARRKRRPYSLSSSENLLRGCDTSEWSSCHLRLAVTERSSVHNSRGLYRCFS